MTGNSDERRLKLIGAVHLMDPACKFSDSDLEALMRAVCDEAILRHTRAPTVGAYSQLGPLPAWPASD